jgi:hypothetical protein
MHLLQQRRRENARGNNRFGIHFAQLHHRVNLDDGQIRGHRHDWVEIPRRLYVGQVAPAVGLVGFDQRDIALQRLLEHMQPAVDFAGFLALPKLCPRRNRREKSAKACRMAAHPFADGALRQQFQFKALGPIRVEEGAVVAGARIRADHLAYTAGIDQPGQSVIAVTGIVGDDRELPGALFVEGIEQIIRDTDGAKSGHQYRRSVTNPGHGVGGGLHALVDHVKTAPSSGIVVWSPWLTP